MEHESDGDTNYNWCTWYGHQRTDTVTGGLRNKKKNGGHPNYSIMKITQNTEESPGHLRRIAVTQTAERNHRLTLLRRTLKGVNDTTTH